MNVMTYRYPSCSDCGKPYRVYEEKIRSDLPRCRECQADHERAVDMTRAEWQEWQRNRGAENLAKPRPRMPS